ncbi:MAG: hypothetical protein AB7G38_14830 [Dehalococcoidia bacterium]
MSESEGHSYLKDHQLQGEAIHINLAREAETLIAEAKQAPQGRAARTLVKDGPLRITLLGLKEGAAIADHRAGGPVSIEVVTGSVVIEVGAAAYELAAQEALVLDADVVHSVRATADAAIQLVIALAN